MMNSTNNKLRQVVRRVVASHPGLVSEQVHEKVKSNMPASLDMVRSALTKLCHLNELQTVDIVAPNARGARRRRASYYPPGVETPESVPAGVARPFIPDRPELPSVTAYGYVRGTKPTLHQLSLMHIDAINQPMEPAT